MEKIRLRSNQKIEKVPLSFQRDELQNLDWSLRLMGIKGARGVGKTTMLLQHLRQTHGFSEKALYISLDDIYFTEHKLVDVVEDFYRNGGLHLYLDEVHKYPNWSLEIKNLYDNYPDLQIVFTGSSMLDIQKSKADLSRRAIMFAIQGLSFRQFLKLKYQIFIPVYPLQEVLENANEIIASQGPAFKPYPYFREYLKSGYYPFFMDGESWFFERLDAVLHTVIEADMAQLYHIDLKNVRKIYQLLLAVATAPPFVPNIQKLSERVEISRNTLLQYLYQLASADMLVLLQSLRTGLTLLQKPEKILLENTNLLYAIAPSSFDAGALRETFVLNQLKAAHKINYPDHWGDFVVDGRYFLEVGGPNKKHKPEKQPDNAYIIADNWDYKTGNKVPIWLLGLLY